MERALLVTRLVDVDEWAGSHLTLTVVVFRVVLGEIVGRENPL